jgi:hypothetical protein
MAVININVATLVHHQIQKMVTTGYNVLLQSKSDGSRRTDVTEAIVDGMAINLCRQETSVFFVFLQLRGCLGFHRSAPHMETGYPHPPPIILPLLNDIMP